MARTARTPSTASPHAGTASVMNAIVHTRYGTDPAQVLKLATVSRPTPADDEVLIRVRAASVDRGTWHIMAGVPYPIRLAGFGLRAPKHLNPGRCLAGTVATVGRAVNTFTPGDEVFGTCDGSFAEYVCAKPAKLALKPPGVSFAQAAAISVSGVTALQAVRDHGRVHAGQHVLVIGASGGVGGFAVQIANASGATVTGVSSSAKLDHVTALGADHVIDYTTTDFASGEQRYDVILDIGGNRTLTHLRRALAARGVLVLVGGETDERWLGGMGRTLRALMLSPFLGQQLGSFIASENAEDLELLAGMLQTGEVKPRIDRTYPLAEVGAAITHLADGAARGKTVVTF